MPTRITKLTDAQKARLDEWADRWSAIGLRTGATDWERFEAAAKDCYRFAGIPWPGVVVRVSSPLALAFAAPTASYLIDKRDAVGGAVRVAVAGAVDGAVGDAVGDAVGGAVDGAVDDAVGGAVRGAVDDAVRGAVDDAVSDAVRGAVSDAVSGAVSDAVSGAVRGAVDGAVDDAVSDAVGDAVRGAVSDAVSGAVRGAVDGAVDDAVRDAVGVAVGGAVGGAVDGAVDDAVRDAVGVAVGVAVGGAKTRKAKAVLEAIRTGWANYIGGQFWCGGWYWGGAWTSYFREVCGLVLEGNLWDRAKAYEATIESACWWWPHRRFVMVCARPTVIHREVADPANPRGFGSHRLHCADGPAIAWPDGWGIWYWHGVRVTRQIIEAPETLTVQQIESEPNAEVRRVMVERFGAERYIFESGAELLGTDECGALYRKTMGDDEPLVMVHVVNSTPEPDGSLRKYMLRVPPTMTSAREAVAWTFGLTAKAYRPSVES